MNPEPRIEGDAETVCFDADVHGSSVRVEVGRHVIEDLVAESMSSEQRLDFVKRNRDRIVEQVRTCLRDVPPVTGILVGRDQLKSCNDFGEPTNEAAE